MDHGALEPDLFTFHLGATACSHGKKWRYGAEMLQQVEGRMLRSDLLTYHVLGLDLGIMGRPWNA